MQSLLQKLGQWRAAVLSACAIIVALVWAFDCSRQVRRARGSLSAAGFTIGKPSRSEMAEMIAYTSEVVGLDTLSISDFSGIPGFEFGAISQDLEVLAPFVQEMRCPTLVITDDDAATLGMMSHLEDLLFDATVLTDRGARKLAGLRLLRRVEIRAPKVSDRGLSWLGDCNDLFSVRLSGTGVGDDLLAKLATNTGLLFLNFADMLVSSNGIACLRGHPSLRYIYLSGTAIDDGIAVFVADIRGLRSLDCARTKIGDATCRELGALPELTTLVLDGTELTDAGVLAILQRCRNLQKLSVNHCRVSAATFLSPNPWPNSLRHLEIKGVRLAAHDLERICEGHRELVVIGYTAREFDEPTNRRIAQIIGEHRRAIGQARTPGRP